jgi:hypothetical protein
MTFVIVDLLTDEKKKSLMTAEFFYGFLRLFRILIVSLHRINKQANLLPLRNEPSKSSHCRRFRSVAERGDGGL